MKKLIIYTMFLFLSFSTLGGEVSSFSNKKVSDYYRGKGYDLIVLNYWATYCSPCKKEMPDLEKLYQKYRDKNVLVVGASIDVEKKGTLIKKIVKKLNVNYPVLYGVSERFNGKAITGLPKTIILDRNYQVIEEIEGKRDFRYFDEQIKKYLNNRGIGDKILSSSKENSYYKFQIDFSKQSGDSTLNISLQPKDGFHLNGKGYPDLSVSLENEKLLGEKTVELKSKGIPEKGMKVWTIEIGSLPEEAENIRVKVKAIVCTENSCRMIKDEFEVSP